MFGFSWVAQWRAPCPGMNSPAGSPSPGIPGSGERLGRGLSQIGPSGWVKAAYSQTWSLYRLRPFWSRENDIFKAEYPEEREGSRNRDESESCIALKSSNSSTICPCQISPDPRKLDHRRHSLQRRRVVLGTSAARKISGCLWVYMRRQKPSQWTRMPSQTMAAQMIFPTTAHA